jgi:hypothetical protein
MLKQTLFLELSAAEALVNDRHLHSNRQVARDFEAKAQFGL